MCKSTNCLKTLPYVDLFCFGVHTTYIHTQLCVAYTLWILFYFVLYTLKIIFFNTEENIVWMCFSPHSVAKPCLMWTYFVLMSTIRPLCQSQMIYVELFVWLVTLF